MTEPYESPFDEFGNRKHAHGCYLKCEWCNVKPTDPSWKRSACMLSHLANEGITARRKAEARTQQILKRMTPEQRALYDEILEARQNFGRPVDVNQLIRDARDGVAEETDHEPT